MKAGMKFTINGGFKIISGIAEWHKEIIFKGFKATSLEQPQVHIPVVKNIILVKKRGRIGLKIKGLENQIKRLYVGDLHAAGGSTTIGNLSKSHRGRVGGSKTILGEMGWRTLPIVLLYGWYPV